MNTKLTLLWFLPAIIFADLYSNDCSSCSSDQAIEKMYLTTPDLADIIKQTWIDWEISFESSNKEDWIKWIARNENQNRILEKIQDQMIQGGLDSSKDMSVMLDSLETALCKCSQISNFKPIAHLKKLRIDQLKHFSFRVNYTDEQDVDDHIQSLREEEKEHKDAAYELILQATGEAIAAGACAAGGMEIPAIAEGVQATRHFIQGCEEYNEGIRCQQEADLLEQQNDPEDKQSEKKWWEFWK